jgi:arylformamidase
MNIIDISWPVSENITEYKDRITVSFPQVKKFDRDGARESIMSMNVHTGTHVDAPAHFLAQGATIDATPLTSLVGPCIVLDCTNIKDGITDVHLTAVSDALERNDIVLLKTRNSELSPTAPFNPAFVFLAASGAKFLLDHGVKAVGIDYLGVERSQPDHATHVTLLGNGIPIIEGLRLAAVQPGRYNAVIAPLLLLGCEAAPARAFLVSE